MWLYYTNSLFASAVSMLGCGLAMGGLVTIGEDAQLSVFLIIIGAALILWGRYISNEKAFETWWQQVEQNGLEAHVATDLNVAIEVYKKNPQERTINKIATLNPQFADHIRKNIANK